MAKENRDSNREVFWRGVLKRHAQSGLCRREQLSEPSFYAWRRTLRERDAAGQQPQRPAFLPVAIREASPLAGGVVIELRGGHVLRLPESIETERLAALVHAIESGAAR